MERNCFFMVCTNSTEKECLERNLFGDVKEYYQDLKQVKKHDIAFLINISKDELIGVFEAESSVMYNYEPNAWSGRFPSQIKVRPLSEIKRIPRASERLKKIVQLKETKKDFLTYYIPKQKVYGSDITEKLLMIFDYKISDDEFSDVDTINLTEEIQTITLDNIIGLDEIKKYISQRIIEPLEDIELAKSLGVRVGGGMLLFGPPGTGKTHIAKTVAGILEGKFINISPSIIVGYPGEAEKRIEKIFSIVKREPRAVIFLDEAEWILNRREDLTSSVMQRVIPVLLAQLSKMLEQKDKPILVIAATNKPESIDDAFLRPGRFDRIFYVGLPNKDSIVGLFQLYLRNRKHNLTQRDLETISEMLEGYSGADIVNLIEEASYLAFLRIRKNQDQSYITIDDVYHAIENVKPSVSIEELERLKKWAEDRGIKV